MTLTGGGDFDELDRIRQDQLRAQARAALRAFRPVDPRVDEEIDIACASWSGLAAPASPERLTAEVQAYVDEVLK